MSNHAIEIFGLICLLLAVGLHYLIRWIDRMQRRRIRDLFHGEFGVFDGTDERGGK